MPVELDLGQDVGRGDAQERARRECERKRHQRRRISGGRHAGKEECRAHGHQQREERAHEECPAAAAAARREERGDRHGVERLVQEDHEERADARDRPGVAHRRPRLDACRERHALEQRMQAHAHRRPGPRQPPDAAGMPAVRMMVTRMPVVWVVARRLRRLVLVEVREALKEEHRHEAERKREHDRVELPVAIAAGRGGRARHQRVRQHVEDGDAEHHAGHEAQPKLQAPVRQADPQRHRSAEERRRNDGGTEDEECGLGSHGRPKPEHDTSRPGSRRRAPRKPP